VAFLGMGAARSLGERCKLTPAGSGAEPRPPTHFGRIRAHKTHLAGANFVYFQSANMRLELQIQSEGDGRSAKHDTVVVSRPSVRNVFESNYMSKGWGAVFNRKPAISLKRGKREPILLFMTNRKSHMRFRLVP